MIPDEMSKVYHFLQEKGCLIATGKTKRIKSEESYDIILNKDNIFQVYLYRAEYINKLEISQTPAGNYYMDVLKSYCIEFSIGGFYPYSQKELHKSRFYYISKYYDEMGILVKDDAFRKWADDIFSSFKKRFLRKDTSRYNMYFTEQSVKWIEQQRAIMADGGQKFIIN